jgi:aryl-alcohol dehydrogenase-like predicted oxidoreductase
VIGLGCWSFGGGDYWGPQEQDEVNQVVARAIDLGVTYFDTAEGYNEGRSEESLGRAIREHPRDSIVIGTKVAPSNAHPKALRRCCDESLRRLATDYIDIYMVHWPIHLQAIQFHTDDPAILSNPPTAPEAFQTLKKLQDEGKIRHIGVSNFGREPLDEALETVPEITVNQVAYSLISRAIEWDILPYCLKKGVGSMAYMPLWQGMLTDAFAGMDNLPPVRRRTRHFNSQNSPLARHGEGGAEEETESALMQIREVADRLELPVAQLALNWSFANPGVVCSVVGARSVRQVEHNVASADLNCSSEVIHELNQITRPLMEKLGPSFDYFESTATDRTHY